MITTPRKVGSLAIAIGGAAALAAAITNIGSLEAQTYPTRPITLIAPFPPGGANDMLARILAERMRRSLGQHVIVENITGGSGSIGTGRVARASGDGYTLGLGALATHVVNGAVLKLAYDVRNDFEPVALLARQPLLVLGKKHLPANNLEELVAWLKANPNKASFGTAGPGSMLHLAGVLFQTESGTRVEFVPYRGAVLAMQDLVAGQIDMMIDQASNALPQVQAGAIKAYALTAKGRLAAAPDIPTVEEAGLPGVDAYTWQALFAPKGTPKTVITKLNAAVADALADPAMRARLADLGQDVFPPDQQTPEALAAFQKAEIAKWWPIIKAVGISAK
jgi:tripartite-type tricarboxylate transporter receptor subunit TctC